MVLFVGSFEKASQKDSYHFGGPKDTALLGPGLSTLDVFWWKNLGLPKARRKARCERGRS